MFCGVKQQSKNKLISPQQCFGQVFRVWHITHITHTTYPIPNFLPKNKVRQVKKYSFNRITNLTKKTYKSKKHN
jgi:hypothetical protein